MLIFCNNSYIDAGQGSSKSTNEDKEFLSPEAELTEEEKALLFKILSNKKVLQDASKIIVNSGQSSSNKNMSVSKGLNNVNSSQLPNFTVNINANPSLTNNSTNSATNSNEVHVTQVQQLYNLLKEYSKATRQSFFEFIFLGS